MSEKDEPTRDDPKNQPDPEKEPDWKAEAEKWKELSRKNERAAKANADAAKRLQELEDADKSESEKAAQRAADAEKRAQEAELRALRLEVGAEKGLTPAQARRLVGATKEELESDADELLETFRPSGEKDEKDDDKGEPPRKPREKLTGGGDPTDEPDPDVAQVVAKTSRY